MTVKVLELTRLWAMATGLLLAAWFFGALYLGVASSPLLPMLITGIGGFEIYLFCQDTWRKRRGGHG